MPSKSDELGIFTGSKNMSIIEAMERIDKNTKGILYILEDDGRLYGSLTDGDIRRWILRTGGLEGRAADVANKSPKALTEKERNKAVVLMDTAFIKSIPILDDNNKVIDILFRDKDVASYMEARDLALSDTPIVIMAGGKGTRLYPYTKILPKPLIPIGDVPILERIMNRFHEYGAKKFYLTVNYKKEMIKSYFIEQNVPYEIVYVEEDKPLGTAGSIKLIKDKLDRPVLVTNCDILIDADYDSIIKHHIAAENGITIVSSLKNFAIPYGVLDAEKEGVVTKLKEKPSLSYFINTGMYVVNPEVFKMIPDDQMYHMTNLAEDFMKKGGRVGMYPISEMSFLDMGEFQEMKRMEDRINEVL
ncbi:MAG: CBS domain-containing protein [Butyrivibrio sp.]|uniref:nucleotidyltransferase family protein n=1 Tax=Butyrivibrio sp. NC2002 TaxID=1410610 RepID=UPI00068EE7BD|nr:nucleotidyltransferase family protein [Butyrivibrio sp. NC2002]MBE5859793.1 CBS domain-containing protein [Butyrivibrio sp.]